MTAIDGHFYWDGGLFDNTPLGAVLDRLDKAKDVRRTVYVVNPFPNKGRRDCYLPRRRACRARRGDDQGGCRGFIRQFVYDMAHGP